jgi:transcriptional regulator with XRE-family HTH domain
MASAATRLKNLRQALEGLKRINGWQTQNEIAAWLDTDQPNISAWINGKYWPSAQFQKKIAQGLGLTIEQFENLIDGIQHEGRKNLDTAEEILGVTVDTPWEEKVKVMQRWLNDSV